MTFLADNITSMATLEPMACLFEDVSFNSNAILTDFHCVPKIKFVIEAFQREIESVSKKIA
jgi:hypothetical protein